MGDLLGSQATRNSNKLKGSAEPALGAKAVDRASSAGLVIVPVPEKMWQVLLGGRAWALYFKKAESSILEEHRIVLTVVQEALQKNRFQKVAVVGSASSEGDPSFNKRLIQDRAREVVASLGLQDSPSRVLHELPASENYPVMGEVAATEEEREARRGWNRRTVISLPKIEAWEEKVGNITAKVEEGIDRLERGLAKTQSILDRLSRSAGDTDLSPEAMADALEARDDVNDQIAYWKDVLKRLKAIADWDGFRAYRDGFRRSKLAAIQDRFQRTSEGFKKAIGDVDGKIREASQENPVVDNKIRFWMETKEVLERDYEEYKRDIADLISSISEQG